ncbi:amidohydrolase [Arthrobacter sp. ERGS1:01]|uniref:metal-dependent hydrolase family protein n=1 Tax=Arthrobacter sp. ERGS1:01 TaxID=1704044 RepID=UPI0006B55D8D|nr:amidohydrolase family protein [Arthrobacter sp. ERGS1:01]ALE07409.1 amidohydrolase [Arthrobacter sp. ERGS1:01]
MNLAKSGSLNIFNALIFDGNSADLVRSSIQIADGRIAGFGEPNDAWPSVDAGGRFVMPGLIDAHFHAYGISLDGFYNDTAPLSFLSLVGAKRLAAALARGFTSVRDVAGGDIGLAMAVTGGHIESPRYFYTGPALSQTGGHGDPRSDETSVDFVCGHSNEIVDGADNLRRAVRERFRTGAHAVKIMASGGVISPSDPIRVPQYSAGEIQAVVEEAERRGSYVAAHAYSSESIVHAVANGVRSIEHGNLMDDATAAFMAERGSFLVPTLAAYDAMSRRGEEMRMTEVAKEKNAFVLDAGKVAVARAHAAGVRIGFGSDLLGALESEQLRGLRLQSEVLGMLDTLRSVTSVNAELMNSPTLGRLTGGAVGDILILDANPLENPSSLWDEDSPRTVIQNGKVVHDGLGLKSRVLLEAH